MFSTFARQRWTLRTSAALLSCYSAYSLTSFRQKSLLDELPQPSSEESARKAEIDSATRREAAEAAQEFCAFADNSPSGEAYPHIVHLCLY
jgi:hypothetical protein